MRIRQTLVALAAVLVATCATAQTEAPATAAPAATPAEQARQLADLEKAQRELLKELKRQLAEMPETVRKQRLRARIAEIEGRANPPRDLYISPSAKMSGPMKTYYARMRQRIEDCGTRHFPSKDGKRLYGQGIVGITLANDGAVIQADVLQSSQDRTLDAHMLKIVQASAPFGTPPAKPMADGSQRYRRLVVITGFDFNRDSDKPDPEPVPAQERCKWE
ncbi:protein TonB [Acidovorax soli]|uniref:Protein TonB n=1 Tax=Acidovorax soli TaxID=592050 RepID=A0A7X0PIE6_9BURK|nr:TonB family protein [Acidovorax soli]MBB6561981.1 protein TonB [Acidovorax soli]